MSTFTCDDKQTLIAYLYDEVDAVERASVEAQAARCASTLARSTASTSS